MVMPLQLVALSHDAKDHVNGRSVNALLQPDLYVCLKT